jgi:hypothetical protein
MEFWFYKEFVFAELGAGIWVRSDFVRVRKWMEIFIFYKGGWGLVREEFRDWGNTGYSFRRLVEG